MGLSDCVDRWTVVSRLNGSNANKVRYLPDLFPTCTLFITASPEVLMDFFS